MGKAWLAAVGFGVLLVPVLSAADWQIEMVDQTGIGRYSSLKLDQSGNAHLVYVVDDGNHYPLKYGFWDHALKKWFLMTVAEGASYCSLALDSSQRPHISWADYGTMNGARLRYAHWNGKAWERHPIPLNSDVIGYYNSIALDAADRPRISFYEYRGARDTDFHIRLRVVAWNGTLWEVRTIDGEEGSGKFNAMASGPNGVFHLAYANVSASTLSLRYAFFDGKDWKPEVVEGLDQTKGEGVGYSPGVAVDKEGNPHLVYFNMSTPQVRYAVRRNRRWQIEVVDSLVRAGYPDRNSIALDEDGTPYVSYYDAGRGILKVAHRDAGKWVPEIVDSRFSGFTSSLQISNGTLCVSYADEGAGGIKVARRTLRGDDAPAAPQTASEARAARPN